MTPHFSGPLVVRKDEASDKWVVHEELTYWSDILPMKSVIIPIGFETDFASVPRGLWNIFPPDGDYNRAAVVHDYLYATGIVERKVADSIFLEAMGILNVGWIARHVMWSAVRMFGFLPWKKCRKICTLKI